MSAEIRDSNSETTQNANQYKVVHELPVKYLISHLGQCQDEIEVKPHSSPEIDRQLKEEETNKQCWRNPTVT